MLEQIEKLIDDNGLEAVLAAIAETCFLKADHIASNWQDVLLAKCWRDVGQSVDALTARTDTKNVSVR